MLIFGDLTCVGLYRSVSVCIGLCRSVLVCVGLALSSLKIASFQARDHLKISEMILVCVGLCRSVSVYLVTVCLMSVHLVLSFLHCNFYFM